MPQKFGGSKIGGHGNKAPATLPAAAAFVPTSIPNLLVWSAADQRAYTDAGSTLATDGQTVQQWNDLSGNGNNWSQATGGLRPTFKTNITNSKPVIRCAGTGWMTGASVYPSSSPNNLSLVVVSIQRDITGINNLLGNASATRSFVFLADAKLQYWLGSTVVQSDTSVSIGSTDIHQLNIVNRTNAFIGLTEGVKVITNGNLKTNFVGAGSVGNTTNTMQLGALNSGFINNGDIAEILLFGRILKPTEANNLTTYLNGRYGTSVPLWPTDKQLVFDGDSITAGAFGTPTFVMKTYTDLGKYTTNAGSTGAHLSELVTQGAAVIDPLYDSGISKNIVVVFAGTNDIDVSGRTGAQVYADLQTYISDRHSVGWKVLVVPMLPRGGAGDETQRIILNNAIAADSSIDGKVSTAAHVMWSPGNNTDTTYYDADALHPNTAGHAAIATAIEAVVNSL